MSVRPYTIVLLGVVGAAAGLNSLLVPAAARAPAAAKPPDRTLAISMMVHNDLIVFAPRGGEADPSEVTYKKGFKEFESALYQLVDEAWLAPPPDKREVWGRMPWKVGQRIGVFDVKMRDKIFDEVYSDYRWLEQPERHRHLAWPTVGQLVLIGDEDGTYNVVFRPADRYLNEAEAAMEEPCVVGVLSAVQALVAIVRQERELDRHRYDVWRRMRAGAEAALKVADEEFRKVDEETARLRGYPPPPKKPERLTKEQLELFLNQ